jgi:type IV secretory pathway VirB4 component
LPEHLQGIQERKSVVVNIADAMSPHLGQEALAVLETPHGTPYAFNLHVQDVGHTLVLGATGSGKSFFLNFLITHAQKYAPLTVVLDVGHSYRKLTTLLNGRYVELGLRQHGVTINPFALDPTRPMRRVLVCSADSFSGTATSVPPL